MYYNNYGIRMLPVFSVIVKYVDLKQLRGLLITEPQLASTCNVAFELYLLKVKTWMHAQDSLSQIQSQMEQI